MHIESNDFRIKDAAGKDGAIEHVMSGVNPQGCRRSSWMKIESGGIVTVRSWISSGILIATARGSSNSSCIYPRKSSASDSSIASIVRKRTGNSVFQTSRSAGSGGTICGPTRNASPQPVRNTRRGMCARRRELLVLRKQLTRKS